MASDKAKAVKAAARAHSDLHVFAAVMALMESSLVSADSFAAEERIVKICRAEQQKCLARYDRAVAMAVGGSDDHD